MNLRRTTPRRHASGEVDWSGRISPKCWRSNAQDRTSSRLPAVAAHPGAAMEQAQWGHRLSHRFKKAKIAVAGSWRSSCIGDGHRLHFKRGGGSLEKTIFKSSARPMSLRDGGVGEGDRGFAMPHPESALGNIDPPTTSNPSFAEGKAPTAERTVDPAGTTWRAIRTPELAWRRRLDVLSTDLSFYDRKWRTTAFSTISGSYIRLQTISF